MPSSLSYTPPRRFDDDSDPSPVRRRHVLYIPGYDPDAKARSRSLFVRELIRYGRRFGLVQRDVTRPEELPDVPGSRWHVTAARDDWTTETTYDVLLWDDLVRRDFRRPVAFIIARALATALHALMSGLTLRLFRMNWIFASVTIYPVVMVLLLGLLAAGAGLIALLAAGAIGLHPAWGALAGVVLAAGVVTTARGFFGRWYVWHLLRDWLFNWDHGRGARSDYWARVERFAEHLVSIATTSDADEILVVGHSSGAGMAVEIVGRALERDPRLGRHGPDIAVATLGTSHPVSAMNNGADAIRGLLRGVMTEADVLWVEFQAPQDWLNAAGFNPVRMLPLGLSEAECHNPVIRSALFRDVTSQATYRAILKSPFRLHFQFMMANEKPGAYDYVMMLLGPMRLSARVRDPDGAERLSAAA
jgi:hypothetical protein